MATDGAARWRKGGDHLLMRMVAKLGRERGVAECYVSAAYVRERGGLQGQRSRLLERTRRIGVKDESMIGDRTGCGITFASLRSRKSRVS